jgi:hypothetical protein
MKRTWPIIGVRDVAASSAWYQTLLGQPQRPPDHDDFDQIEDDDGTILVCLHEWGGHGESPPLESPDTAAPGNGVLLSILVEDFEACLERAQRLGNPYDIETEHRTGDWRKFKTRDPDGYYIDIYAMQDIQALRNASSEV